MSADSYTRDELYSFAQQADITGRSDMDKAELHEALQQEAPHLLDPFAAVTEVEPGDKVQMNHLKSVLTVTEVRVFDGTELTRITEDGSETQELDTEVPSYRVVIMRTNRGGRHALVAEKEAEHGPAPWKRGDEPHLRRWRAGDREWMNNSTDPLYLLPVTEDSDDDQS